MQKAIKILLTLGFCIVAGGCTKLEEAVSSSTTVASPAFGPAPSKELATAVAEMPSKEPAIVVAKMPVDSQLPEIELAVESALVASPSAPTAYLLATPLPAGTRVHVVGADQDAAWLLVLHGNTLGWIPAVYSRTGVGTLKLAVLAATLSDTCGTYLGATFAPEETWVSNTSGTLIMQSTIYRPRPEPQSNDPSIEIGIEGGEQIPTSKVNQTPLDPSGEVLLFTLTLAGMETGTRLRFQLNGLDSEPLVFQAAFFGQDCTGAGLAQGTQPATQSPSFGLAPTPLPVSTPIIVRSGPPPSAPTAISEGCTGFIGSRLAKGMRAHVTLTPQSNIVRSGPGKKYEQLFLIAPGTNILIISDRSYCDDNARRWEIEVLSGKHKGKRGWVAESDWTEYWLNPGEYSSHS